MSPKIVKLPVPSPDEGQGQSDTERKRALFAWALEVLEQIGTVAAIAAAKTTEELRRITLDVEMVEIVLAIRDALHPASGVRAEHFRGLKEGGLKQVLKNRFAELKKDRLAELGRAGGQTDDWTADLVLTRKREISACLANLVLILRKHPVWKDVLGYDEFAARVIICNSPPWGAVTIGTIWGDQYETLSRVWFQRDFDINPAVGDVGRAVQAAARHNAFHPVRDYFEALVWDGVPRLETWLQTYFHVDDSEYVRAIGPRYLISAVARIYSPGAQVDHVLVLEGPQGKQKSSALRVLAIRDVWFAERLSNVSSKDAQIETAGVLLIEIAEMEALLRASASASKSFLTRRYDRFRPPYGKHTVNQPRQCVFAASINPPVGGYLKDPTGARRFWPVVCCGTIDIIGLERARDQLWAEAVHRYKAKQPWWLETDALEALATAEQAARFVVDAWEAPIRSWVTKRRDVSIIEVLEGALGLPAKEHGQTAQNRVAKILTHLGFRQCRPRTPEGTRPRRYQRDVEKDHQSNPDHPDR
jgi:predicted P-loop ATPase